MLLEMIYFKKRNQLPNLFDLDDIFIDRNFQDRTYVIYDIIIEKCEAQLH